MLYLSLRAVYFTNTFEKSYIILKDSFRHKGLRRRLVNDLAKKGISNKSVLQAMDKIPRHLFLDKAFEELAYEDKAFPIAQEQTISQPYTVAYQTQLLDIKKRDKVLEVGTGSGYQACVLAELGARLYTVERQEQLHKDAQDMFLLLGYELIRSFFRDGYKGLPEHAPFDRILVTAGAPIVPPALKKQLAIGGILVIPVGEKIQKMYKITRLDEDFYKEEILDNFRFVPFVEGKVKHKS